MTSIDEMRLRNREVSILFMQKEHAATLKGLHEEIRRLQQKCSGEVVGLFLFNKIILCAFIYGHAL